MLSPAVPLSGSWDAFVSRRRDPPSWAVCPGINSDTVIDGIPSHSARARLVDVSDTLQNTPESRRARSRSLFNAGPTSQTLSRRQMSVGWTSYVRGRTRRKLANYRHAPVACRLKDALSKRWPCVCGCWAAVCPTSGFCPGCSERYRDAVRDHHISQCVITALRQNVRILPWSRRGLKYAPHKNII